MQIVLADVGTKTRYRFERFTRLRPGAFGLFLRGELRAASRTNWSNRVLGTVISFLMTSVKC